MFISHFAFICCKNKFASKTMRSDVYALNDRKFDVAKKSAF